MFTRDLSGADVVVTYLPSPLMERLLPQFEKLKPGSRIVSHQFEIPGVRPGKSVTFHLVSAAGGKVVLLDRHKERKECRE